MRPAALTACIGGCKIAKLLSSLVLMAMLPFLPSICITFAQSGIIRSSLLTVALACRDSGTAAKANGKSKTPGQIQPHGPESDDSGADSLADEDHMDLPGDDAAPQSQIPSQLRQSYIQVSGLGLIYGNTRQRCAGEGIQRSADVA